MKPAEMKAAAVHVAALHIHNADILRAWNYLITMYWQKRALKTNRNSTHTQNPNHFMQWVSIAKISICIGCVVCNPVCNIPNSFPNKPL